MKLILASTSPYRASVLQRLGYAFEAHKPLADEDEIKKENLSPKETAKKTAELKAHSLKNQFKNALIIGGDQTGDFKGQRLDKPHTQERAIEQLLMLQGQTHYLHSAVCLYKTETKETKTFVVTSELKMRSLTRAEIERYVLNDNPLDCCGSYKFEVSGIKLFSSATQSDESTIMGLPLMELQNELITFAGLNLFS